MIIIGIDPGIATTGYGVIQSRERDSLDCIDYGIIKTSPGTLFPDRLKIINDDFISLIEKYNPNVIAVESIFFFKNAKTVIPVSQVKGIFMMVASQKNIPIHEFTPLQAKMATVGHGRAQKKQVQEMVKLLLNLDKIPKPDDAADALAIAICYASLNCK